MSDNNNTLYIVGGVVAVAALGAFVLSKNNDRKAPALGTPSTNVGPSTSGPVIGGTTGATGAPGASLGQTQNMQADLEAQRLANQAQADKVTRVRKLWSDAIDIENQQLNINVSIDGITKNVANYNAFLQQYITENSQGDDWNRRLNECIAVQDKGCIDNNNGDWWWACRTPSRAFCTDRSPTISANRSRNPMQQVHDAAPQWAKDQLQVSQNAARQSQEATLNNLATQYKGTVDELTKLGYTFKSKTPSPL